MPPTTLRHAALVAATLLASAARVDAQSFPPLPPVVITVNDQGVGNAAAFGQLFPLAGVPRPDPAPGGLAAVLTYDLLSPPGLLDGDVLVRAPGGALAAVIRFNPAGTGGDPLYPASLLFYSTPPLALSPFTAEVFALALGGDMIAASYRPGATDPGFVPGYDTEYRFEARVAAVPEPAPAALLGAGLLGLGLLAGAAARRRIR